MKRRRWPPQAFRRWRRARELRAEIARLNAKYQAKLKAAKTEDDEYDIFRESDDALEEPREDLDGLHSVLLVKKARYWQIPIPQEAWRTSRYATSYIGGPYHAELRSKISEARRAAVRTWGQFVLAVIGVTVAVVGLWLRLR